MYSQKKYTHKISAILLAAGGSTRLGRPKQLINYKNKFLINHMIETIKEGGIENIYVVLGANHDQIAGILSDRSVNVLNNPQWESGISSSIKIGVKTLNKNTDAVCIFVVDQPFLNSILIKKILDLYQFTHAKIIANRVNGRQTHPVLFRIDMAKKLLDLTDKQGGRQLIEQNKVLWLDSIEKNILRDIDTPDDLIWLNQD